MNITCKNCGADFSGRATKQHCSAQCFSEWRRRPEVIAETLRRRKETSLEKFGTDNPAKSQEVIARAKKTCIAKYGTNSPTQNPDVRKKQVDTLLRKYSVDNPQKNLAFKEKQRETMMANHGVYSPLNSPEIAKKARETNLLRYGQDNPAKSEGVKKKTKATSLARYGAESPMGSSTVQANQKSALSKHHYNKIKERSEASGIELLFIESQYTNSRMYKEYPVRCKKCQTEFLDCFTHGRTPRCPTCYPATLSKAEDSLFDFIIRLMPADAVERKNRTILVGQELDIYIPSKKLAIEFNGNYWHSERAGKKYKNYHINKTKKCDSLGILLIHIFEDEWLYKQDVIKKKLTHLLLPTNSTQLHARKCEIRKIDAKSCNMFLSTHHIQGGDKAPIRYGAYHNGELVSVMTFGKLRLACGSTPVAGVYELYRYCATARISGLISKFVSAFKKEHLPSKIITYADRRFSNKATCGYSKCGFTFIKETSPNYWYLDKNYSHREHRFQYRKSELKRKLPNYIPALTEWENMQANNYDRIWDCGHLKYEMVCA